MILRPPLLSARKVEGRGAVWWATSGPRCSLNSSSVRSPSSGRQLSTFPTLILSRLLWRHIVLSTRKLQFLFSLELKEIGKGKGGTARKTAVYRAMYEAEESKQSYEEWKRAGEGIVTARNTLAKVYSAFGPVMFLDPFWFPANLEPGRRSPDFAETLAQLIQRVSQVDEYGASPLAETLSSNRTALQSVLDLFWPAACKHVLDFCDTHPPNIPLGDLQDQDSEDD
ncbi:hypothetical protein C8R47DRAFT_584060 [Mycena vitilis]|nr:hypothetical protein C8R47DRAFT_584060 [Mycena vitilis]